MRVILTVILAVASMAAPAAQFGRPASIIQPDEAAVPIGMSQPFQLLDAAGKEVLSNDWSVSNPAIASLAVVDGHAVLTGRSAGTVTVSSGASARSATVLI